MLAGEAKIRMRLASAETKAELAKTQGIFKGWVGGLKGTFSKIGGFIKTAFVVGSVAALAGVGIIILAIGAIMRLIKRLKGVWETIFAGQSEEKQKRFTTAINGIKEAFKGFVREVGKSGLFDAVLNAVETIWGIIQKWSAEGKLKSWAETIGNALGKAVNFMTDMLVKIESGNWEGLGKQIGDAISSGLEKLLMSEGLISKMASFGMKLGTALIKAFFAGLKSLVVNPKDFDKKKNPLLWLLFSGGWGETLGQDWQDIKVGASDLKSNLFSGERP
ncbi:MAG: hypothetical protein JW984_15270 [Deltaproteobacteria bacterium]|uniref:Uncharacterized protein n=1 Tax=Candidatus Zymogenus saltonus TaxID=2844893 RepID=A0A9D8KJT9_9DELT|nr:hypothetical protein [Candidatus Zymogenus saltonus]